MCFFSLQRLEVAVRGDEVDQQISTAGLSTKRYCTRTCYRPLELSTYYAPVIRLAGTLVEVPRTEIGVSELPIVRTFVEQVSIGMTRLRLRRLYVNHSVSKLPILLQSLRFTKTLLCSCVFLYVLVCSLRQTTT
jgi:hypothetical protein